MKWFKKEEFNKVKKLIDDGAGAKAIGDWYWDDFKNNATNLVLAYEYAISKGAEKKSISKLESLLKPQGKIGPLQYNDVVTEIWNNNPNNAKTLISLLIDNNIPFQIKSGDLVYELMTDPVLSKALETNPDIISNYMPQAEKHKIKNRMLETDNYDLVVKSMEGDYFEASSKSVRAYSKSAYKHLAKKTLGILNKDHRRKYLSEYVYTADITVENLYDTILEHYAAGTYNDKQLVELMSTLSYKNAGNGGAQNLIYHLVSMDKIDVAKEIMKVYKGNIIGSIINAAQTRPHRGKEKLFGKELEIEDWILEFADMIDSPEQLFSFVSMGSDDFKSKFIDTFPEMIDKMKQEDLPDSIKDIFIF